MVAGGASETGGVKPMVIAGRMVRERERLIGMSPEERAWRKQWLKDQELHHGPRKVPALELELNNPIKRFYRAPLDKVCNVLEPVLVSCCRGYYVIKFLTGGVSVSSPAGLSARVHRALLDRKGSARPNRNLRRRLLLQVQSECK